MRVSISNVDPHNAVELDCELYGSTPISVTGEVLTAGAMDAHNTFEDPQRIVPSAFTGARLGQGRVCLTVPAMSVVVLEVSCG